VLTTASPARTSVLGELCRDLLPKACLDDGFVLTRMGLSAMRDLTEIEAVDQQAVQGSARK
jgi:hypothetical protein